MSETTWKKEPAIKENYGGCLNCGPRPSFFPPDGVVGVGFGYAALRRDVEPVWIESNCTESEDDYMAGARTEDLAVADSDHNW